jgi:hypothetical protein
MNSRRRGPNGIESVSQTCEPAAGVGSGGLARRGQMKLTAGERLVVVAVKIAAAGSAWGQ